MKIKLYVICLETSTLISSLELALKEKNSFRVFKDRFTSSRKITTHECKFHLKFIEATNCHDFSDDSYFCCVSIEHRYDKIKKTLQGLNERFTTKLWGVFTVFSRMVFSLLMIKSIFISTGINFMNLATCYRFRIAFFILI